MKLEVWSGTKDPKLGEKDFAGERSSPGAKECLEICKGLKVGGPGPRERERVWRQPGGAQALRKVGTVRRGAPTEEAGRTARPRPYLHFTASSVLIPSKYFCSRVGFLWDREICVLNVVDTIMGAREPQRELELERATGGFGDEKRLLRESSEEMNVQRHWGREGEACGQGM